MDEITNYTTAYNENVNNENNDRIQTEREVKSTQNGTEQVTVSSATQEADLWKLQSGTYGAQRLSSAYNAQEQRGAYNTQQPNSVYSAQEQSGAYGTQNAMEQNSRYGAQEQSDIHSTQQPTGAYSAQQPNYAYGNPAYQNPYYAQPYQGYPMSAAMYQNPPKQKKPNKLLKVLGVAMVAIFAGVLAGSSFIGVNLLYRYRHPQKVELQPSVSTNTTNENDILIRNPIQNSTVIDSKFIQGTSVSNIAEKAMPSTVAITSTFTTDSWLGRYETPASGSGIIVGKNDSELLIVTNNHVIDGANKIRVTLIDETEAEAIVKGTASFTDLAVIALRLEDLSPETMNAIKIATLGSSDEIKVGEMVVAIGNALGYGQSVTVGYVSAKDREITIDNNKMTLLQTDAAINPGNSGGALLNLKGEVIGINSVKYAREEVEGVCFAIPVSNVEDIIENLINSLEEDEKGYLGVGINDVTEAIAEYYSWPIGVYVVNFSENSAAEEAGIQIGDIITGINGVVVKSSEELIERVTANRHGTTVTVTLQRNVDGEFQEITVDVVLRQLTK